MWQVETTDTFDAFDPDRKAIVLCAGEKAGQEKRFYQTMIALADRELERYLKSFKRGL